MLSLRRAMILRQIIEQYIDTAVPVPSESLVNKYKLSVSSATVRNEMARLEQEGYILRPHTSAGSIPSDKGYRYYVESLREVKLSLSDQCFIGHLFHQVEKELVSWFSLSATSAARSAQNVAIITTPKPADCRLKHLELVAIQDSLVLIILVLQGAKVKQQLKSFSEVRTQSELTASANKLNSVYFNLTQTVISAKNAELTDFERQVADALIRMMQSEDGPEEETPYLDGWHFMLNQPEFAESHRMTDLMEMAEERKLVRFILSSQLSQHGVHTIIGKENKVAAIQNCSVIISHYGLPNEAIGTISIIGPTRMPYHHIIATVDYLSWVLSVLVAELYGKQLAISMLFNTN